MTPSPSSPAHEEKLKAVIFAIVKAVPEVACSQCDRGWLNVRTTSTWDRQKHLVCDGTGLSRSITLEDVLRALQGNLLMLALNGEGGLCIERPETDENNIPVWHLGKPISDQSEECISFLHSLLCPKK